MRKITFLLFLIPICIYSQTSRLSNKKSLQFEIGLEYRITPMYPLSSFFVSQNNFASFVNTDLQNAGLGINLGVEYFISNNFSIGFLNTIRYDYIVSGQSNIEPDFGVASNTYGLLIDYHLSLNYHFKLFEKGNFFLSAGFSLLNTNSDFTSKQSFFDNQNNLIGSAFSTENFSYWASRYEIGYVIDNYKIGLGITSSTTTNYFDETTSFIVPFAKFSLLLGK